MSTELIIDGVTVYSSGTGTPPVTPQPPVTPPTTPPPGPPPATGALAEYDARPSSSAKILFMTDAENTALQASGRATFNQMANLIQWFGYNGWKSMRKVPLAGGGFQFTYDMESPPGSNNWIRKIDNGSADPDNLTQPVPRAP